METKITRVRMTHTGAPRTRLAIRPGKATRMTESMNDNNSTIESESSVEPSLNTESKNKV